MSITDCRDYVDCASSTTNFYDTQTDTDVRPSRPYAYMAKRCRHLLIRQRNALLSYNRLQEHAVSSALRATDFLARHVTIDGHDCDTSLVLDPSPETRQQRRRYVRCATDRRSTDSATPITLRSPVTQRSLCRGPVPRRPPHQRLSTIHLLSFHPTPSKRDTDPSTDINYRIGGAKHCAAPGFRHQALHKQRTARATSRRKATHSSLTACIAKQVATDQRMSWQVLCLRNYFCFFFIFNLSLVVAF